jgi:hypothetical protein
MTCGVSFLAVLAKRVGFENRTQGTPLLLPRHRPQLLVIARLDVLDLLVVLFMVAISYHCLGAQASHLVVVAIPAASMICFRN